MIAYENMTPEEQEIYRENHTTHGQRHQEWEDWQEAKKLIMIGLGILFSALYLMVPLVEMLVL